MKSTWTWYTWDTWTLALAKVSRESQKNYGPLSIWFFWGEGGKHPVIKTPNHDPTKKTLTINYMYKLIITFNNGSTNMMFFYKELNAVRQLTKYLIDWYTDFYDFDYDINDYPFHPNFWYSQVEMLKVVNNILSYIKYINKDDDLIYPIKYDISELFFR